MMCKCYIQNSKVLGTCTLVCFIAEILITVMYPPTELQGLVHPYLAHRNGVLKLLFSDTLPLSSITWLERTHSFSDHLRSLSTCILKLLSTITGMWTLLLILLWSNLISASQIQMPQEHYMNRLNMSFGINYNVNGLLHHCLERVWVVTKRAIPKLEDIHFQDINFDPDCKFTRKLNNARQAAKYEIQSICKSMKPLISFIETERKALWKCYQGLVEGRNT